MMIPSNEGNPTGLVPTTVRQARKLADRYDGPFSCFVSAPNGFYGLSTVVTAFGHTLIVPPYNWDKPRS
jgi:hypothetical protein